MEKKTIKIAGAGIAGLTSAIILAKSGYKVRVFERNDVVGKRFRGDLEGLMNWGFDENVLEFMNRIGIRIDFWNKPVVNLSVFNSLGRKKDLLTEIPFVYLVRRGNEKGTLDHSLKMQAIESGAEILFNRPISPDDADIIATGPKFDGVTDAMASGYTFRSDSEDIFVAALSNKLSFKGYSYLLIADGLGTISSCVFGNYNQISDYLNNTVAFFKKNVCFDMKKEKKFTGFGSYYNLKSKKRYIGEAGGFQDFLWGFGMRYAMITGSLAAKSLIENKSYENLWKNELSGIKRSSETNRFWFSMLNDSFYNHFIDLLHGRKNILKFIDKMYRNNAYAKLLYPIARIYFRKNTKDRLSEKNEIYL